MFHGAIQKNKVARFLRTTVYRPTPQSRLSLAKGADFNAYHEAYHGMWKCALATTGEC